MRHTVALLAAVFVGSLALAFVVGAGLYPCEAEAQSEYFNLDGVVDPAEGRVVARYVNGADPFWQVGPDGAVTPEEAEAVRRRSLGRAIPKAVPGFAGFLLRSTVYSAATAVVWHDTKMVWKIAEGDPLQSIAVNATFQPTEGGGAVRAGYNPDGKVGYVGQLSSVRYGKDSAGSLVLQLEVNRALQNIYCQYVGSSCSVLGPVVRIHHTDGYVLEREVRFASSDRSKSEIEGAQVVPWASSVTITRPLERVDICEITLADGKYSYTKCAQVWPKVGESPQEGVTVVTPYEVGPSTPLPEYTPAEGDFISTPQQTEDLAHALRADPEYDPDAERDGAIVYMPGAGNGDQAETDPGGDPGTGTDHGPSEWTRENPDGSTTTHYQDGTEVTTWPDGWTYTKPADGTGSWTDPSGEPATETNAPPHEPPSGGYGGPTEQSGNSCREAPKNTPVIPPIPFDKKFPFSLVEWIWDAVSQLGGGGESSPPVIHLGKPFDVDVNMGRFDGAVSLVRGLALWLGGIFIVGFTYLSIKGGKGAE
jgi:hypothetical protein